MHAITILGVVAAFGLLLLSLLALCAERGFRPDLKAVAAFRGLSPVRRFLLIAVLGLLTLSAGTKDGGGTAGAPSARMSAPRRVLAVPPGLTVSETETNLGYRVLAVRDGGGISPPSSGAVTNEAWLRRGGRSDAFRIGMEPDPAGEDWLPDPDSAWAFPYCGSWSYGLTVFAHGEFQPGARTDFFPPPFGETGVSLVPRAKWEGIAGGGLESLFWHELTPSNSLVLTWQNALYGRDANAPTNFQAELFGDGSFDYRYPDRTVSYVPVFSFDWDGDGLENSVDPEPLVAGPDAHGTNAEWYNVVCSNVFSAVEGADGLELEPRHAGVNTNAYYFVDVVAERGPAPIYFTADGPSRLGNPVVVAQAGETNRVPLLIGATYTVTSLEPIAVEAPPSATVASAGDGRIFTVTWPAGLASSPQGGLFVPSVSEHGRLNGVLSWTRGCCLVVNGTTMRYACSGCGCGGCSAVANYGYEGYFLLLAVEGCGCSGGGASAAPPRVDLDTGAYVTVGFDRKGVVFEDAYDNSPSNHVARCSTRAILTLKANGGANGGVLTMHTSRLSRLALVEGERPSSGAAVTLAPYQEYELVSTNAGALASTHLGDIEVTVALTDASTQEAAQVHASASSVRLEMEAVFAAPENAACRRRHVYGVGEKVKFRTFPQSPEIMFTTRRLDTGMNDVTGLWDYELFDGAEQIDASSVREYICPISANYHPPVKVVLGDVEYEPLISLVEPQNVVTTGASWGENNVDFFYEGNRRCWPSGAVGSACLVTTNYIGPMNVSFQGIAVSEVPCVEEDVITGCFTSASGRTHTKQAGAGKAYCIAEGNFWFVDGARADNYVHNWIPNTSSVLTWKIPIGWHRRSKTQDDWFGVEEEEFESYDDKSSRPLFLPGSPNRYKQEHYIDETGIFSTLKYGHWISRSPTCRVSLDGQILQERHVP